MLNGRADCYVLAPERSACWALDFLERFTPAREPSFDPREAGQVLCELELVELDALLEFLEGYRWGAYNFSFRSFHPSQPPFSVILAFNHDGSLLLGASTHPTDQDAAELLDQMEALAGSKGHWGWEEAPLENARQVLARVAKNPRFSFDACD